VTLISVIVAVLVLALLLVAIGQLPLEATAKNVLYVVLIVLVVLWLVAGPLPNLQR
jgi:hypothetical protein